MRLLLDANLSPKRIGAALGKDGHDVWSLNEYPDPDHWHDFAVAL